MPGKGWSFTGKIHQKVCDKPQLSDGRSTRSGRIQAGHTVAAAVVAHLDGSADFCVADDDDRQDYQEAAASSRLDICKVPYGRPRPLKRSCVGPG
jgi:hypothetical protein